MRKGQYIFDVTNPNMGQGDDTFFQGLENQKNQKWLIYTDRKCGVTNLDTQITFTMMMIPPKIL